MNRRLIVITILTLTALTSFFLFGEGAGPLNPPAAPADGTFRTLGEVYDAILQQDPRTPIRNSDLPLTITQPGSYVVVENLHFTEPTGDAITINSSNVTLDLGGFHLRSDPAVTGVAVKIEEVKDCAVQNGSISGNADPDVPVPGGFGFGVRGPDAGLNDYGLIAKDLRVSACRFAGISLGGMVKDCTVVRCWLDGIKAETVSGCHVGGNGEDGIRASYLVVHSASLRNGEFGISCSNVQSSTANHNGRIGILGTLVSDCHASQNEGGILARNINSCTASMNDTYGLAFNNGGGFSGATISNSYASRNGGINIASAPTSMGNYPVP